jgi:hypothetical protein
MAHACLFSGTRLFARFAQFYKRLDFLSLSAAHFLDVEMWAERRNHAELSRVLFQNPGTAKLLTR